MGAEALTHAVLGLAESDCERLRDGLLAQPINTWTSSAYVVAGLWLLARRRGSAAPGIALVGVGIGSVLFHGPQPPGARWIHDWSVVVLLLVLVDLHPHLAVRGRTLVAGAGGAAAMLAVAPAVGLWLVLVGVAGLVVADVRSGRGDLGLFAVLALAVAVQLVGRSGGPLCEPDAAAQLHGVWHVLTASVAALWADRTVRMGE